MSRCFVATTPFGKEIRKRMIDLEMEQKDLAKAVGVSSSYISDVFRGSRSGASIKKRICEAVGLDYEKLMQELAKKGA